MAYCAHAVNFAIGEQMSAAYRKINPHGKVPALVDGDRLVTENLAIMHYVAKKAPHSDLLPQDFLAASLCLSFVSWAGSHVHTAFRQFHRSERFVDGVDAQKSLKEKSRSVFAAGLAEINTMLDGKNWLVADQFSIADPYAYVFWTWGKGAGFDLRTLSAYRAHAERLEARAATTTVLKRERDAATSSIG